jgi:hypothetical protein
VRSEVREEGDESRPVAGCGRYQQPTLVVLRKCWGFPPGPSRRHVRPPSWHEAEQSTRVSSFCSRKPISKVPQRCSIPDVQAGGALIRSVFEAAGVEEAGDKGYPFTSPRTHAIALKLHAFSAFNRMLSKSRV